MTRLPDGVFILYDRANRQWNIFKDRSDNKIAASRSYDAAVKFSIVHFGKNNEKETQLAGELELPVT